MENKLNSIMQTTISDIRNMVEVNKIVGEPIVTSDGISLVPVSKLSFAFGGGGGEADGKDNNFGGGTAVGAKIDPIAFLVIKDGSVNMLNIQPPAKNSVDRILDFAPQIMDKIENFVGNKTK